MIGSLNLDKDWVLRVVELIGETATDIKLSIAMSSARVWGIYMKA
jgi:hypothetical protein